jgi:hypothetical protein
MSGRLRRRRHGSANTGMPAGVKPPKPRSGAPVGRGRFGFCRRFQSRTGNMPKIVPVASVKTKAVGFLPGVAPGHIMCASLGGCDRLVFGCQDTGFPLDKNASPQPIDCEQRGLLPLTIAASDLQGRTGFLRRQKDGGAGAEPARGRKGFLRKKEN